MRYHMIVLIISLAILIKIIDVRSLSEKAAEHDETNINDFQSSQVITLFSSKYNRTRIRPVASLNGSNTDDLDDVNIVGGNIGNTNDKTNTGDILTNDKDERIVGVDGVGGVGGGDDDGYGKGGDGDGGELAVPEEEQYNKEQYSIVGKIVLSSLAGTASLITVCGNLLVMLSFFLDRQIRIPTNYFILSLSVSDFLIGLVSMPFLTLYLMIGRWPFGKIICNLWLSLDYTVCLTSIYTVLFITIDRFCSVKFPAKYRNWRTRNKVIVMVALTWGIPIVLFFPSIFGWSFFSSLKFDARFCDVAWSSNKVFSFGLVFGYFWSTLVAIIVLYIFIYRVARNLERKSREKQRKLSTLVGTSAANAGAVAFPAQVTAAVSRLNSTNTQHQEKQPPAGAQAQLQQQAQINNNVNSKQVAKKQPLNETTTTPDEFQDDQDDDYNTADSQSKLSKGSIKKRRKEHLKFVKRTSKSGAAIGSVGLMMASSSILKGNAKQQANAHQQQQTSSSSKAQQANSKATAAASNQNQKSNVKPLTGVSNNLANNNKQTQLQPKSNLAANNHSFGSSTISKDDDYSSSYDSHSHSDYDTHKHKHQQQTPSTQVSSSKANVTTHKKPTSNVFTNAVNRKNSKSNLDKVTITLENPSSQQSQCQPPQQQQQQLSQSLQPRPESLAVMSYDQFAEKCAKQSSNLNSNSNPNSTNQTKQSSPVTAANINNNNSESLVKTNESREDATTTAAANVNGSVKGKKSSNTPAGSTKEQIPFIDDEFDDLSYILTRRHIADKEHKYAIKEEKILIKSPLKSSFFQKFSSPIRSMSRRSSQKSQNEQTAAAAAAMTNGTANAITSKLEMLSNQFASAANEKNNHHYHHHHNHHHHHNDGQHDNEEKVNLLNDNTAPTTDLVSTNQTSTKVANHLMVNATQSSASGVVATNKITPSSTFTAITTTTTLSNSPTVNCLKQQQQQSQPQQPQQNATMTGNGPHVITTDNSKVSASDHNNSSSNTKLAFDDGIQATGGAGAGGGPNTNNTATGTQTGTISSRHQITSRPLTRMVRHENRARKALRTITFILGAFIFCFAPWHVVTIFNPFCPECFESAAYHHFFYSCYFLCYLNSPINPFMYALANQQFKKTFTRILKGDFRRV